MTKHKIDNLISSISDEWKVKVLVNTKFQKDYGECYPDTGEIYLSKRYTSGKIKFAVFLHELSHIVTMRRSGSRYLAASIFQEESAVWSLAQEMHLKYTSKPFSKSQADFMLKCLKTYCQHHYSFKKKFNKEVPSKDKQADALKPRSVNCLHGQ